MVALEGWAGVGARDLASGSISVEGAEFFASLRRRFAVV